MQRLAFVVAFLMAVAGAPSTAATAARPHSVDYVIGMLEAGVPSRTIIARIDQGSIAFTVEEGDVDRLKAAGADEALVRAVQEAAATSLIVPPEATQTPNKESSQAWSRPQRLAEPQEKTGSQGEDLQSGSVGKGEKPHGGYPYYRPGDDGNYGYGYGGSSYYSFYYGYPYYDPFYVPYLPYYYSYYGYSSPYYYNYYYGQGTPYYGHPGRTMPRGGGQSVPRGSGGYPPSGGAPRGRPVPRGHP